MLMLSRSFDATVNLKDGRRWALFVAVAEQSCLQLFERCFRLDVLEHDGARRDYGKWGGYAVLL